jgi:hypothetical protein
MWYVHHFADYHDIESNNRFKAIELGCFPVQNWCSRYFGLFYVDKVPSLEEVFNAVFEIADIAIDEEVNEASIKNDISAAMERLNKKKKKKAK